MKRLAVLAGAFVALTASQALAADILVSMDEARLVTFGSAVKTVFVGNPLIADVTVIDARHVFVLGKSYGTTNIIALDESGNQTANEQVTVFGRPGTTITLQRGAAQATLTCDSLRCEPMPLPGDEGDKFDAVTGQVEKRQDLSLKAAGTAAQ